MFEPGLKSVYAKYHSVLKPLIAEYDSRNENFVTELLSDLPEMFDRVAIFSCNHEPKYQQAAEQALDNAIATMRTSITGSMMENVVQFKSRFSKNVLMALDGGHFYGRFSDLEKEVKTNKTSNPAKAYTSLKSMEGMMNKIHTTSLAANLLVDNRRTIIFKWIISTLIALIVNWIIIS